MRREPEEPIHSCEEFEERLTLYAADELERGTQAQVEKHLEACAACSTVLERERRLLEAVALAGPTEPDARLLAGCRAALADALDGAVHRGALARWVDPLGLGSWIALHPAWSAAALLLIGFSVGTMAPRLMRPPAAPASPPAASAASMIDDQQLRSAEVSGINWTATSENAPPEVQVQLSAQRPVVVQGTVENNDVKRVLVFVLQNSQRFGPDVRLDSVELLKSRCNDADVREALCRVARADRNPAVRLKALEALQSAEPQENVRETLLDVLVDDGNPGVRIEAINALRALAARGQVLSDPRVRKVLRERIRKDPNTYIRIQSAAAIRGIGPREKY